MEAIWQFQETYSGHFIEMFKTSTTDNGSEFADLSELKKKLLSFAFYYTHPYIFGNKE